jgi:diguanylate cyclase (GGDEF)-like protein
MRVVPTLERLPWMATLRASRLLVAAALVAMMAGGVALGVEAIRLHREAAHARAALTWLEGFGSHSTVEDLIGFSHELPRNVEGVLTTVDLHAHVLDWIKALREGGALPGRVESLRNTLRVELRLLEGSSATKTTFLLIFALGAFFLAVGHLCMLRLLKAQRDAMGQLQLRAETDPLTGCLNRAAFLERAHEEWERSRRYGSSLAVLMIDLDWFKEINDTFGHVAGDGILRDLAHRLKTSLRPYDVLGRYGGDEFIALLPDVDGAEAGALLDRIQKTLKPSTRSSRATVVASCSVGMAVRSDFPRAQSFESLLLEADRALYMAKDGGRGRAIRAQHYRVLNAQLDETVPSGMRRESVTSVPPKPRRSL